MEKLLKLEDANEWNEYLRRIPDNSKDVYFTPEYYSLYENYGDGEACCFVYEKDGNLVVYPFLKNSITTLGYELDTEYYDIQGAYGYNGLISSTDDEKFIAEFWRVFDNWCQKNNVVAEFMRFHPMLKNYEKSKNHFNMIFDRKTVYIDLYQSVYEISSGLSSGAKKHIRKASREVEIRKADNTNENVEIFNDIYRENMDRVGSIPYLYFNLNHFSNLFKMNSVELFIAYMDNKPIACYSGLVSNDYYATYLSASLTEYNKTGCNSLLYWTMIQSAKEHGCHYIHFGGGTNGDPENSLLKYKMNYSQTLAEFWIGKHIYNKNVYDTIIQQWKDKFPESYMNNKVKLLGYREI